MSFTDVYIIKFNVLCIICCTYRNHESRLSISNQYKHICIQTVLINPQVKVRADVNTRAKKEWHVYLQSYNYKIKCTILIEQLSTKCHQPKIKIQNINIHYDKSQQTQWTNVFFQKIFITPPIEGSLVWYWPPPPPPLTLLEILV